MELIDIETIISNVEYDIYFRNPAGNIIVVTINAPTTKDAVLQARYNLLFV